MDELTRSWIEGHQIEVPPSERNALLGLSSSKAISARTCLPIV